MKRYNGIFIDAAGNPKLNAVVKVVQTGGSVLAILFKDGVSTSNPLNTSPLDGSFAFEVVSGVYDFLDSADQKIIEKVQIFDETNPAEWLSASKVPLSGILAQQYTNTQAALDALLANGLAIGSNPPLAAGISLIAETNVQILYKKYRISYTAFTGIASGIGSVAITTFPARTKFFTAVAEIVNPFTHPTATTIAMTVENSLVPGNGNIVGAFNVMGIAGAFQERNLNIVGGSYGTLPGAPSNMGSQTISTQFNRTAGTGNLSALTGGDVDVVFGYMVIP